MTLLSYQVFKTVAESGNFHKAADVLGLTPSAISHTISTLEKELGFSVLTRGKAGVALTSYGQHLLPYVNAVLNSDESLRQVVAEFNGLQRGVVKVGCFSSVCTSWMPQVIKSFKEMYPEIIIEVFQGTYDDVSYWIKNGIVDFGFLSTSSAGDLKIESFYRDPLLCIMPREYAQNREGDVITAEEMSRMHFVVQRKSTDADVSNYMKTNHLDIQTNYHVVDDLSTVVMVESGFGICLMPELTMNDIPYDVVRYRIDPEAYRMIGLAVLNPQFMAPAVRTLYRHIIDSYRNI
ncbi:MAG TPA: LysR family transcriptional regulator [Lachnoclostridium sp.]|nr:LysR family transcriptional regulator [Lachnoclostridium sp.]